MADWTDTFFEGFWGLMQRAPVVSESAPEEARHMRRLLRLRRGSRVLDVPCGDGRISLELARAGCEVVGVDRCEPSVRRARRRFRTAELTGRFHVGDMRRLRAGSGFDAVVNWWGSFGYFDDGTNLEVLRGFASVIRPGGRVLVDQVNRERILRDFREHNAFDYGGLRIITRNRWDAEAERVEGIWVFSRGGRRVRRHSSIRLYTPSQMERLMASAGLLLERLYDGTDGSDYTRGSRRLTAVGRKPGRAPRKERRGRGVRKRAAGR
jgi:SAM-dependent methyltransferase